MALFINKNHFCLIWTSRGISFQKIVEELNLNFKNVDKFICDKHVKSFVKHDYKPSKVKTQLTNTKLYDLETFSTAE